MGDEEDAEDVSQETLLKLWSNRGDLEKHPKLDAYAMLICKNACIDKWRAKQWMYNSEIDKLNCENVSPYSNAELKDAVNIVRKIIDSLPDLQRIIISMRDIEAYELEEIAAITGTKVSAVSMNLSRARKKVREQFLHLDQYRRNK